MSAHRNTKGLSALLLSIACASVTSAGVVNAAGQAQPLTPAQALTHFQSSNENSSISRNAIGRISRVYGNAFSTGQTGEHSAQQFVNDNAEMWGLNANELIARGPFEDGRHVQPIGYLPKTDSYKFTGYYYTQVKAGIPVFNSKLVLLVRNEANNPLVLASSELHDLRHFQVDNQIAAAPVNRNLIIETAKQAFNAPLAIIESTHRVIYAGTEIDPFPATIADESKVTISDSEKYLIVTDAVTGTILYQENLVHTIDLSGNASGLASEGPGADICADEILQPLPYLSVGIQGGNSVFTDINGDFTIPHGGAGPVTVEASLTGQWFQVTDNFSPAVSESVLVTPPGPADLLYNAANDSQNIRAQVNAYIQSNIARDTVLAANPAYPQMQQNQFPVNVNQSGGLCPGNAWYDGSSINFCLSGGGSPNTAWSSVLYHEYGHHLIAVGGSGQGQYGEGMGDVVSASILDDNRLGIGFFGNCNTWLRDANNNVQYPQNGEIHDAGRLLSGCYWSTRQELIVTEPDYVNLLQFLAINSILVHNGDLITPQITIDWLTLDDDDADIGNGTPHYNEIANGFGAHNMDAPPLNVLEFSFPNAQPEFVSPDGSTALLVQIDPLIGSLDASSPTLMVDDGSGFSAVPMSELTSNQFSASFPAADCSTSISYYITAQTTNGTTQTLPTNAPDASFSTTAAFSAPVLVFDDNFETNTGWTVTGDVLGRAAGRWERGIPAGDGSRGDAPNDFDDSGSCYVTGNGGPGSNTDVDDGSTILTSPIMDASTGVDAISYARWYNNSFGNNPFANTFVVEVSDDAGATWTNLETVGPAGSEVSGGWFTEQFALSTIPGFTANNQFQIRFTASDTPTGAVIEAGIDAVQLLSFDCSNPCQADLTGDGELDFFDISAYLTAFGAQDPAADFTGDGAFDFFDISAFLTAFSAGCP